MRNILGGFIVALAVILFVSSLILIFVRDNAQKSSLWLEHYKSHDSVSHLHHAAALDPYNPELWALVPDSAPESLLARRIRQSLQRQGAEPLSKNIVP